MGGRGLDWNLKIVTMSKILMNKESAWEFHAPTQFFSNEEQLAQLSDSIPDALEIS